MRKSEIVTKLADLTGAEPKDLGKLKKDELSEMLKVAEQEHAEEAEEEAEEEEQEEAEKAPAAAVNEVRAKYDALKGLDSEAQAQVFDSLALMANMTKAKDADDLTVDDFILAMEQVKSERITDDAFSALQKGAEGLTPSSGLVKLAMAVANFYREHGSNASIRIDFDADALLSADESERAALVKVSVAKAGAKRGRKAGGSVGSNSRKSAWTSVQDAAKKGDKVAKDIRKVQGGYRHGDRFIPSRANGGLVGYLFKLAKGGSLGADFLADLKRYNPKKAEAAGL